jgi:hypothetical protein
MNDTDVRAAFEELGAAIPDVCDADVVIRRVRARRRLSAGLGIPALAAVVLAATLAAGQLWPSGGRDAQVASPNGFGLDSWAEPVSRTNSAARPGTLIRTCDEPGRICLRRPDGREISLASVRPDLTKLMRGDAFDTAALSWDAKWLGFRAGQAYQLHELTDRARSISVPAAPKAADWEVVGWSPDSRYVALAAFRSKQVARYAWVSLGSADVTTYDPVPGSPVSQALPERLAAPDGVVIASPIDTSQPAKTRPRVTTFATEVLRLTGEKRGTVRKEYDSPPVVTRYLTAAETLAGSRGVASSSCAPVSSSSGRPLCATEVWDLTSQDTISAFGATGAVQTLAPEHPDKAVRWTMPRGDDWSFLGLLPTGEIAVTRLRPNADREVVAIDSAGKRRVVGRVPFEAGVLLPGMALPSCCRDW